MNDTPSSDTAEMIQEDSAVQEMPSDEVETDEMPLQTDETEFEIDPAMIFIKDKIKTMFELQAKLNADTNGECWLNGETKDGKPIDWLYCVKAEMVEAVDSFGWKHWKAIQKPFDKDNFFVELVDIVHFGMSFIMQLFYNEMYPIYGEPNEHGQSAVVGIQDVTTLEYDAVITDIIEQIMLSIDVKDFVETIDSNLIGINYPINRDKSVPFTDEQVKAIEDTIKLTTQRLVITYDDISSYMMQFLSLFRIYLDYYNLGFIDVYKLYIGKNVLNKFRQDNGYKEGTYIKEWKDEDSSTIEDNVYMQRVLKDMPADVFNFENLYEILQTYYSDVVMKKTVQTEMNFS